MIEPDTIQYLLGRSPSQTVLDVTPYVHQKSVMVTGAGGSIGSALATKLCMMHPKVLVLYEQSEYGLYEIDRRLREENCTKCPKIVPVLGGLTSTSHLQKLLVTFEVNTIYHAAAYKHVPLVERNPIVGLENNVWSAKALVDAARASSVQNLVLVSTDKAVNPTNVMGASKRIAEFIALCGEHPYKVVRFGNVLWSNGSVLPLFHDQLTNNREVTITDENATRYFMSIGEAVDLILQSTALPDAICVLDMGEQVKIQEMAFRLAMLLGKTDVKVKYIGLRHGEKLNEELTLGEGLVDTSHPFIKAAHENVPSFEELSAWLRQLKILCDAGDISSLRTLLREFVPGYEPSCGIVDDVWLEENVTVAREKLDDQWTPTKEKS